MLRFRYVPVHLPITPPLLPWPSLVLAFLASLCRLPRRLLTHLQVVVIEQTETPDMLKERNDERAKKGLKRVGGGLGRWRECCCKAASRCEAAVSCLACPPAWQHPFEHPTPRHLVFRMLQEAVVRREKVAVLTQGTLTDTEMLAAQPEASYLLALAELAVPGELPGAPDTHCCALPACLAVDLRVWVALPYRLQPHLPPLPPTHPSACPAESLLAASEHTGAPPCVWIGACAVDVATGQMLLGQWLDDEMRSQVGPCSGLWVCGVCGLWFGLPRFGLPGLGCSGLGDDSADGGAQWAECAGE